MRCLKFFLLFMAVVMCSVGCMDVNKGPKEVAVEDSLHIDTVAVLLPGEMAMEQYVADTLMMLLDSCDTLGFTRYMTVVRRRAEGYLHDNHILPLSRLVNGVYGVVGNRAYRLKFMPPADLQVWDSLHNKYPYEN